MKQLFNLFLPMLLCAAVSVACYEDAPDNGGKEPEPETLSVEISDPVLRTRLNAVVPAIDADGDGVITRGEALAVTKLDFSFESAEDATEQTTITDLSGLEYFLNLDTLGLRYHGVTVAAPVEKLTKLKMLNLGGNRIAAIDPTALTNLTDLRLFDATIRTIDLSRNKALVAIYLQRVRISSLELKDLPALEEAYLSNGALTSLKADGLEKLTRLDAVQNKLTEFSMTNLPALSQLHANGNRLTDVTLEALPQLIILNLYGNRIRSIDVSGLSSLIQLVLYDNLLTEIDLTHNSPLRQVYLSDNRLAAGDFSANNKLELIELENTPSLEVINLKNGFYDENNEYMIVEGNTGLKKVICDPGPEVTHLQNIFRNRPDVEIVTQ